MMANAPVFYVSNKSILGQDIRLARASVVWSAGPRACTAEILAVFAAPRALILLGHHSRTPAEI